MAVINGTAIGDLIHSATDGVSPGGLNNILGVTALADLINAFAGNDVVYAGDGADTVFGGDGADSLVGGGGADSLSGGAGNDAFLIQGVSNLVAGERIDGGLDHDRIDFLTLGAGGSASFLGVTITGVEALILADNLITLTAAQLGAFTSVAGTGFVERLLLAGTGTADLTDAVVTGIDEIRGNAFANRVVLTGVANGQYVNLLGENDSLAGGDGQDTGLGGAGNDTLLGGAGDDSLDGGTGNDLVDGGERNDVILGGAGLDNLSGGLGNDTFRVALPSEAHLLAETIAGGADTDRLEVRGPGTVSLAAAQISGVEVLALTDVTALLTGAQLSAFDSVLGTGFAETLILAAPGVADLTGATVIGIDEIRGTAGNDRVTLTDVAERQFVDGRAGNDVLTGGLGADTIWGGDGGDVIQGGAGHDLIVAGQGADRVLGGVGNDLFRFQGVSDISGLAERVDGGVDIDTMDFSTLGATGPINLTTATILGVEVLRITDNQVTLTAAQFAGFETVFGSGFFETLTVVGGGAVNLAGKTITFIDQIGFTAGNDTVNLGGVADGQWLLLGSGNDSVQGGDGGDTLVGGIGADTLIGGGGADRFVYGAIGESTLAAPDRLGFVKSDGDRIDLSGIDADLGVDGNQAFTAFLGAGVFTGVAGQLRAYASGGNTVLEGDVDGVGGADVRIVLLGPVALAFSDIIA